MGGVINTIGDALGGVGDLIGQGTEWVGERTGLGFLDNAGEYISNDDNAWIQQLLGGAAVGGLGYGAYGMMGGSGFLDPAVAGWTSDLGGYGVNELATWASGAGEGLGAYAGGLGGESSWLSGLGSYLPSGSTAGMLGLGGLNLLGQYYGAQQQQKGADDAFSKQLAAQQAYQNVQRQDIANAQNQALANWMQYGFPSQAAVQAGIDSGKKTIGAAMPGAEHKLDEQLAARGFNPGTGEIARGFTGLGQQRLASVGDLTSKMTQFGLTPYSAPPITTAYPGMPNVPGYSQPLSFGERASNMLGGVTGTMGGIAAYDWLKNR